MVKTQQRVCGRHLLILCYYFIAIHSSLHLHNTYQGFVWTKKMKAVSAKELQKKKRLTSNNL